MHGFSMRCIDQAGLRESRSPAASGVLQLSVWGLKVRGWRNETPLAWGARTSWPGGWDMVTREVGLQRVEKLRLVPAFHPAPRLRQDD